MATRRVFFIFKIRRVTFYTYIDILQSRIDNYLLHIISRRLPIYVA